MIEPESLYKVPLTPLRRIIRDRMTESAKIPQFSLEIDVELGAIAAARQRSAIKPSITACLIWCCARALQQTPEINGFFRDEGTVLCSEINLGVAMSVPGGLIVPVIREAEKKKLEELSAELAALTEKVRKNRLTPDDVQDGTFTLSNLGMFGIKSFTPLLNPPQLAIMGVGGTREGWRLKDGRHEAYQYAAITLTLDHRAVDGAVGARFLGVFKEVCEQRMVDAV